MLLVSTVVNLFSFLYMAVLCASLHLLLSIPCLPPLASAGCSLWLAPFFFAAYNVSLFTCFRHKFSHLIFPATLTFLYRLLQSLPRAPLEAAFLFFLIEKEAMQGANIMFSAKLLFTDVRTMLCCKVLNCRWLSICPHSPPFHKVLTTITEQKQQQILQTNTTIFVKYKVRLIIFQYCFNIWKNIKASKLTLLVGP